MEGIAVTVVGMLSEDMPPPAMLRVDTLVSVLAVDVVTNLRGPRAARRALQGAHVIGMDGRNWGGYWGGRNWGGGYWNGGNWGWYPYWGWRYPSGTGTTAIILTGTILRTGTSMTTAPYQDGDIFTPDPSVILFRRVTIL